MMILYGLDLWAAIWPLLTPRWQQGMATLQRLLGKSSRQSSGKPGELP